MCARAGWTLVDLAQAYLDGGARLLQIRAKRAEAGWLLDTARAIVARAAAGEGAQVIVNDRADIARLSGAHGIHVGQEDLTPALVRAQLGDKIVVGVSTHTPDQLTAVLREPVSYVAIGPVFATGTKDTGYDSVGLERVRQVAAVASRHGLPVVAIGGITIDSAADVVHAGAQSVAIISDLLVTGDPAGRVREYLRRLAI